MINSEVKMEKAIGSIVFICFVLVVSYFFNKNSDKTQEHQVITTVSTPSTTILKTYQLDKSQFRYYKVQKGIIPDVKRSENAQILEVVYIHNGITSESKEWVFGEKFPFAGREVNKLGFRISEKYRGNKNYFQINL